MTLVKIETTLDVDLNEWRDEFHIQAYSDRLVKQDIKTYFEGLCQAQLETLGLKVKAV